jgi:hypothetical protein
MAPTQVNHHTSRDYAVILIEFNEARYLTKRRTRNGNPQAVLDFAIWIPSALSCDKPFHSSISPFFLTSLLVSSLMFSFLAQIRV